MPGAHQRAPLPPPIDDDERAFRAAFGRTVEWHRTAQMRALWRAFWPGALVLLPLGSLLVALSLSLRSLPLTIAGLLVTASGPLWAVAQLLGAIRHDLYVAIRVDGLCLRLEPDRDPRVYAWERILDVRYDAEREVIELAVAGDEPVAIAGRFTGLELAELSRRIRDARRLAVWNRLSPRFCCAEAGD